MTERMSYVNIMGNIKDIDRMINRYLSRYDIHLEYTSKELSTEKDLCSVQSSNPYTPILREAEEIYGRTGRNDDPPQKEMPKEEAVRVIESAADYLSRQTKDLAALKEKRVGYQKVADELRPFIDLDFNVENLSRFEYIKYQFGRMPLSSFRQFESYLYKKPEVLFVSGYQDAHDIWGVYFVADTARDEVESMFASLHFEKMNLPFSFGDEFFQGRPAAIYDDFVSRIQEIDAHIADLEQRTLLDAHKDKAVDLDVLRIAAAYHTIKGLAFRYDIRKYAAKTTNDFYIFVGWMVQNDAKKLEAELEHDDAVVYMVEEDNDSIQSIPPTKLKNPFLFRPFELFVRMYGLPAYGEIDPTPFLAITYTLLFGIMFGDAGQGLALSLVGGYLYLKKGLGLGAIMAVIGCSSAVFGLLFGSFFGIEFHPLWMHPAEPSNINTILLYTVVFGILLIVLAMAVNVANAVRKKEYRRILFDPNGVMGLLFYGSVIGIAYAAFAGGWQMGGLVLAVLVGLPLLLMAFREPILHALEKKAEREKAAVRSGLGLFLFETVIEAFELVLSYFTNTVSFVRVGAFALSHASMMGVVMMLSGAATGSGNMAVIVLGNLLVMCLEGLIVGIQVLRLEFYEMFSRFYTGSGREFVPYNKQQNN